RARSCPLLLVLPVIPLLPSSPLFPYTTLFRSVYHSIACRAAIKAGMDTTEYELRDFTAKLLAQDDIRYCPHGRPVLIELSKNELDRKSTGLNSSHVSTSYAVFCLKKKNKNTAD